MRDDTLGRALRLLSDAWEDQRHSAYTQLGVEGAITRLPDFSFEGTQQRSAAATALLQRMDAFAGAPLPHPVALAMRQARYRLSGVAREAEWYWTVMDPAGIGFFGLFAPSAYCGGFILQFVMQGALTRRFAHAGDFDRYLALLSDLAHMVEQLAERTAGQATRGMRIPKPQLSAARAIVSGFRARAQRDLVVEEARIPAVLKSAMPAFLIHVQQRIGSQVMLAFDRLAAVLSPEYEAFAPAGVGMSQYEGGTEIYAELVKRHTTTDLTPGQVHERGVRRMEQVQAEMRRIRADVGLADDPAGYLARAHSDPRYSADSTEDVALVFQRYIDRMDGAFDRAFHRRPRAPHGVAPLPEALQGSMTFGYYDAPNPGNAVGRFFFNAGNLKQQPLYNVASLTYHELVPGHHLHLSSQQENDALHPLGRFAFCNAFNEGWAEYAATLAGEMGMYEQPEERYGRLIMDAFLSCRLVVDTGMNALGWTLERARDYMRRYSSMTEAEVLSESLRYSCDLSGQALAYKLGDTEMLRLRERMKSALGARFDIRDFHAAVLSGGALPLPDLAWHLDSMTESLR